MIYSDFHIHTTASYDAKLPIETLIQSAREQNLAAFGITDHANFNDRKFISDIETSAQNYREHSPSCPEMILGVEFTPIAVPEYEYIKKTGTREGFVPVPQDTPYEMTVALTLEEMRALGIRYSVGASHWRVDVADPKSADNSAAALIREWVRQQMWLIADPRITILGHPWSCNAAWRDDFSQIPHSMHDEMASAMLQYHTYIECNSSIFVSDSVPEGFRRQYAEYLRYMVERGVKITYGSDCHGRENSDTPNYPDFRPRVADYLAVAGFRDGDFTKIPDMIQYAE